MHSYVDDLQKISNALQSSYDAVANDESATEQGLERLDEAKEGLHSALHHLLMQKRR
ncbi:hypothetical protein [Bacillus sp. FJAT-50079]|uniref:hypothetical protein n=1 Tax=Bacillus sp. FJAT-50079 TaxID=2833577 RepID=UPI001BC92599|nr:hypothetical protein [Bacillus sp. FJAT-50079]MBS4209808.1 hypothetical protein [Bacillus sp. FJAT-50079]